MPELASGVVQDLLWGHSKTLHLASRGILVCGSGCCPDLSKRGKEGAVSGFMKELKAPTAALPNNRNSGNNNSNRKERPPTLSILSGAPLIALFICIRAVNS